VSAGQRAGKAAAPSAPPSATSSATSCAPPVPAPAGTAGAAIPVTALTHFATDVLISAGMRAEDAATLADSLVAAEASGVATHGVSRLVPYVAQLQSGQVNPRPNERVLSESAGSLLVDADSGFGAPVGIRAIEAAMDKALGNGIALAGVTRVAHFGAAAFYTRHAAEQGFLAFAMSSTSPSVVPFGGRGPRIGNSPMSFAAPGPEHPELVLDMAQSMSSRGRIKIALDAGDELPEGWAVDADGAPTRDPARALAGGVLTSGAHKGSALSLMVEMLASGLTGANLTQNISLSGFTSASGGTTADSGLDVTVGNFYLVIDGDVFGDVEAVRGRATRIADYVRQSEPAPGAERVRAPGDPETDRLARSAERGITLRPQTLRELGELAGGLGLDMPFGDDDCDGGQGADGASGAQAGSQERVGREER
jgi:LDH2 family malate/lactate/ureidoglycolate dehydrogenase